MEHLNEVTVARLVDEEAGPEEERHLDACARCRDALEAYRRQTEELGDLPVLRPPRGDWKRLSARLRAEGLIGSGGASPGIGRRGAAVLQAAAAVVLFVGGVLAGRTALAPEPGAVAGGDAPARQVAQATSPEEAAEALFVAEQAYYDALLAYREKVQGGDGGERYADPATRYAALEAVATATQAAISQAPADPFLNGLLVSTVAEREAALDRMARRSEREWF